MSKTIRGNVDCLVKNLREIDEHDAAKWIEENYETELAINDESSRIDSFAVWAKLPQGHDYWMNIAVKMRRAGFC